MGLIIEPVLIVALLEVAIGLWLLTRAADEFVEGAANVASAAKISPVVIGAVIVGFGTSAPELLVSGLAAWNGDLDLGVGNVVGSNVANLTHSLGSSSGVVSDGLGFMYNNCMMVFDPRPGRAGSLAPGKARFTAMCPTILFRGDDPYLLVGAPGGTTITMGVLQAILNVVDFGMDAQQAVHAPRFTTTSDTIEVTNRILRRTERELQDRGYPTKRHGQSYMMPTVQTIRIADGSMDGGADPSGDGMAMGI